ncbi:hypothetical protein [Methanobrevibacter filiformis]|uniref:Uncharacterized protein n=1 Tax=Methanobrevibacter filiformis TaxID=55758 RepID=A0A166F563_9EURY|nr:hypothetical protein [Methanobrevibacter filiformis]KZX17325.1 hypothetical protein MBFIL_02270 [Methanobrevibacter filiformis]
MIRLWTLIKKSSYYGPIWVHYNPYEEDIRKWIVGCIERIVYFELLLVHIHENCNNYN